MFLLHLLPYCFKVLFQVLLALLFHRDLLSSIGPFQLLAYLLHLSLDSFANCPSLKDTLLLLFPAGHHH